MTPIVVLSTVAPRLVRELFWWSRRYWVDNGTGERVTNKNSPPVIGWRMTKSKPDWGGAPTQHNDPETLTQTTPTLPISVTTPKAGARCGRLLGRRRVSHG